MTTTTRCWIIPAGDFLFRWRSYLPLALVPLMVAAVARWQYPFGHRADLEWEAACIGLSLAGVALRVWTVGVAAPGTSGRNTRAQKASVLNTTGPYSLVRHPLYLANGIIILGLALFPHAWLAPAAVAVLALGYYAVIAAREEEFLRRRFGREFDAWATRVPALLPAPGRYVPPARAFDLRGVVRREFYGLTVVLVAPLLLDVVEDVHETGRFDLDPLWTVVALIGVLVFITVRFLKKRTGVLRPPGAPRPATPASRPPG
jgi:protein-S-isoprenylcysteine O-methyltransferase Ste14